MNSDLIDVAKGQALVLKNKCKRQMMKDQVKVFQIRGKWRRDLEHRCTLMCFWGCNSLTLKILTKITIIVPGHTNFAYESEKCLRKKANTTKSGVSLKKGLENTKNREKGVDSTEER